MRSKINNRHANIEVFHSGKWRNAGRLTIHTLSKGYKSTSIFEYDTEYAASFSEDPLAAVSCCYPVRFEPYHNLNWPAFILDILPSGYGRQRWQNHLGITDGPSSDWQLLLCGASHCPGNIRIANTEKPQSSDAAHSKFKDTLALYENHPGFNLEEVVQRTSNFEAYIEKTMGTHGAFDVQGAAPKMLMDQDLKGQWHAAGRLNDKEIKSSWIIKFPRGNTALDRQILRNEAAYMKVAKLLGLRTFSELSWKSDALLIPRFDRLILTGNSVSRIPMESMYSITGTSEYGSSLSHNDICKAIVEHCSNPEEEIFEYIIRDIVNLTLGNKDNHARNTAILRHPDGPVTLSPLYDFAPMYLDPDGISRMCRWDITQESGGDPDWEKVLAWLEEELNLSRRSFKERFNSIGKHFDQLPHLMKKCGVDEMIIKHLKFSIEKHRRKLLAL